METLAESEKGGIYIFQYKYDPNIYYIGRTTSFNTRFRSHINHKTSDKFHIFANLVGWDKFIVSIIEFCDKSEQGKRELLSSKIFTFIKFYIQF